MRQEERLFHDAVAYFKSHMDSNITSDELAQYLCVSKATLFRCFQKCAGTGVHRYFLKMRIEAATELLKEGFSVAQTADRLGFGSPSYFSARYKQEMGICPSEVNKLPMV